MLRRLLQRIAELCKREPPVEYYTTDGHVLAPHPGMTDDDLRDFEAFFNVPTSFPEVRRRRGGSTFC